MIEIIILLIAGIMLILPGLNQKSSLAHSILTFETVVGVIALVVGLIHITGVIGITLIVCGLVLAVSAVAKIPKIGMHLRSAGQALAKFRMLIGIIAIVMAVVALF